MGRPDLYSPMLAVIESGRPFTARELADVCIVPGAEKWRRSSWTKRASQLCQREKHRLTVVRLRAGRFVWQLNPTPELGETQ